jgi:hypothetical protein
MILTDDEIRKAAEFAAAQMWPESGYVGWTEDDAVFHRKFIEACLEKLRGGVELPAPTARFNWNLGKFEWLVTFKHSEHHLKPLYSHDQLLAYGAAQRLAGREQAIEECAAECLVLHANGNYKHDTREDCHDTIRALAASPREQT